MRLEFRQMFASLKKIYAEAEAKRMAKMIENANFPDYETEWEYHEYEKRMEDEEYDLCSEYPFK